MVGRKGPPPPMKSRVGSSSQAAPSFDQHKFTSKERELRFIILLSWVFLAERQIRLQPNEYPELTGILDRLKWWILASPNDKFDPEVVREFYANAYPSEEGGAIFEHKSWVRGKTIRYDRDIINTLLNEPYEKRDDSLDEYHMMLAASHTLSHGFNNKDTTEVLCIPGMTFSTNSDGKPLRIYRKHMTTLAQTLMIFLLHNVIPNSHVSSLPLQDCYLIYSILKGVQIDVAQIIANEIYKTAANGGKKGTMGFPSLITTLCAQQGVQVNPADKIKLPITKQYIQQNCREESGTSRVRGRHNHMHSSTTTYKHNRCMIGSLLIWSMWSSKMICCGKGRCTNNKPSMLHISTNIQIINSG